MSRMTVGQVTTLLYLVPAAAIIISLIWLSQIPSPIELAGGVITLAGVTLASSRPHRGPRSADVARRHRIQGADSARSPCG
jgi:drug/metabolite transporter (DMT)-like permease